jgi:hypothetical protein
MKKLGLVDNNLMKYIIIYILFFIPSITLAQSYQVFLFYDKNTDEIRLDRFVSDPVQLQDPNDTLTIDERANLSDENSFQVVLEAYQYTLPQDRKSVV